MTTGANSAYHRVPSEPELSSSSDELRLEDEQELADEFVHREAALSTDNRVRWIHFILGCAVLLPWNGTRCINVSDLLTNLLNSHDYCNTVLRRETERFSI